MRALGRALALAGAAAAGRTTPLSGTWLVHLIETSDDATEVTEEVVLLRAAFAGCFPLGWAVEAIDERRAARRLARLRAGDR